MDIRNPQSLPNTKGSDLVNISTSHSHSRKWANRSLNNSNEDLEDNYEIKPGKKWSFEDGTQRHKQYLRYTLAVFQLQQKDTGNIQFQRHVSEFKLTPYIQTVVLLPQQHQ